ncbi:hypothetical protein OKW42_001288 [Paraburkholderia sp. WC7.3d]
MQWSAMSIYGSTGPITNFRRRPVSDIHSRSPGGRFKTQSRRLGYLSHRHHRLFKIGPADVRALLLLGCVAIAVTLLASYL